MTPRSIQAGRVAGLILTLCLAQAFAAPDRIAAIDNTRRVALPNHVNPRIRSGQDQGAVDASMELPYVTLVIKPSTAQQADLDQLTAQQQDPSSPNYHQWLTPEQYADRFGASQADIEKISAWLSQQGLAVKSTARSRNAIVFSGNAGQIGAAFGVEIHRYLVGGALHYANSANPTVPAALDGVVLAIHGLTDFRLKPLSRLSAQPRYTVDGAHQLGPGDISTIYDVSPLYSAGVNGAGTGCPSGGACKLAVAGQTDIDITDIEQFRNFFGLPANDPTVLLVPGSQDPGTLSSSGDLGEADLDIELSGAVARNAAITFVNSTDVMTSLRYAIDENLAPVLSISYGDCEADTGKSELQAMQSWAIQANAQGQTIFAASGDDGAADCFGIGDGPTIDDSLNVDAPGSIPEVTSVGGTEFAEGSGSYWNSKNASYESSALRYIPETSWNDSIDDGSPASSGGGASTFFTKPSWQTGTGVPADGWRDVPDVSLAASPDHDGYEIVSGGQFQIIGGTSVGAPQFAGIALLVNQYLVANGFQSGQGLGNMNPSLYALARTSGIFHDITSGTNIVTPCASTRGCTATPIGYNTTVGYDLVTGLGTPDVYNLVTAWHSGSVTSKESVAMKLAASETSLAFSGTSVLTATVTSTNGGTPSGNVAFSTGTYALGTATLGGSGSNAVAALTLSGLQLAAGANTITASYAGDNSYLAETATAALTVTSTATGTPTIGGVANAGSYTQSLAPGGIVAVFGTNLASATANATTVPLPNMLTGTTATINGVPAPLYYVSGGQVNVQIPFEAPVGSNVALVIDNNGKSVSYPNFLVASAAPAIFTTNAQGTGQGAILNTSYQLVDASHPATPGSYIQIYCMALGAVSNTPADGAAAPSSPPFAESKVMPTVTIGGIEATVSFAGLAPGFVGEYQVNAQVPAGVTAGSAVPVVVSVGGVTSNKVTIAVQ